ncbi:heparinase II/III-family protein, partial [Acidobacteria bacterium AH-259-G07]|nr:heparinase II/III-family protein [Acidobacteria bacterium AH-259-G07]
YSEDPQLLDVVEETRVRINRFVEESIGQDGGFQEGVGYWHGIEPALVFAAALKQVTGDKVDMFQHSRLEKTIQFPLYTFVPPRGSVPFEDSYDSLSGNYALYIKLAQELNSSEAKWLAQFFHAFDATSRPGDSDLYSIIWPESEIEPSLPGSSKPMSMHFRTIDWVVMRASWEDQNHPLLAAKGGVHDDPHHGHLDAGQFAIAYRGEWHVKELGYLPSNALGYWDHRRRFKDYVHANSLGHNVIFVNGEQQEYGPQYSGKVIDFQTSEVQDYALIDATKAYPGKELKSWRRHIAFKKPHLIVLMDEVESVEGAEIAVRVHPGVVYNLKQDHVFFEGERGKMANLPLLPTTFSLREGRHAILPENQRSVFRWVPYYELITKATGEKTYITNVFVPVENEREAQEILGSSDAAIEGRTLRLTVTYRGRQHLWEFDLSGRFAQLK